MKQIHLIFNSHIDPIWLWHWPEGLDAALATFRSACERLDKHPDLVFNQGEAWLYQQVERVDPDLFGRIRKHFEAGRWEIVGGWWVQPDCNQPSGFALERQIQLGKEYFQDRFGVFPREGYNVDSFGHAASLPGYMRAAGQDRYVMMRPQEHEKALPARLFRWRGFEGGPEVVTFRIAGAYCTGGGDLDAAHVGRSLTELPEGVEHTMCFLGVGDHGGGPTERLIDSCRKNADAFDGWRLVFSSPRRFFDAIWAQRDRLPLVTGELQMHAVGCYTVHRAVKVGVRRAEHLLVQAGVLAGGAADPQAARAALAQGWEQVCLHHFHDTLGGTCLPSAYRQVDAQLGQACALADEIVQVEARRLTAALGDDRLQRLILLNASDQAFDGYSECEPWLNWRTPWQLIDEQGAVIGHQRIDSESVTFWKGRVVFRLSAAPGQMRVLRIQTLSAEPSAGESKLSCGIGRITSDAGLAVHLCGQEKLSLGPVDWPLPRLELLDDPSDTWSHDTDAYVEGPASAAEWGPPCLGDQGPLMASLVRTGRIGQSDLLQEWRVYHGEGYAEMLLRVSWRQRYKILKLVAPFATPAAGRTDGIPGGSLQRPMDSKERPLRDWTLVDLADGGKMGVLCPEVYALDASPLRLRLTLLRSPLMAHHIPRVAQTSLRGLPSDQGVHEFRFRFYLGAATADVLDRQAFMLQRPLVRVDLTRGMPAEP